MIGIIQNILRTKFYHNIRSHIWLIWACHSVEIKLVYYIINFSLNTYCKFLINVLSLIIPVWGYGIGFCTLIVVISNIGVFLGPFMNTRIFKRLLMFCVALAVGTLAATGFIVLIPEVRCMFYKMFWICFVSNPSINDIVFIIMSHHVWCWAAVTLCYGLAIFHVFFFKWNAHFQTFLLVNTCQSGDIT